MIGERATTEASAVPHRQDRSPSQPRPVDISEKPNLSPLFLPVSDWSAGAALNIHWLRAMAERQWGPDRRSGGRGSLAAASRSLTGVMHELLG